MAVGSSLRLQNYQLFAAADLGVSVAQLPGDDSSLLADVQSVVNRFPKFSQKSLCQADLIFIFSLISLHTIPMLQTPYMTMNNSNNSTDNANNEKSQV